jgi:hypothetical protein
MSLAGSTFTLRGQLDDPTATVTVSGLTGTPIGGIVERNGLFWVEDLPLVSGDNTLTFTATDAAVNHASQNLTVVGTDLEIVINEIPEEDYADSKLTVIGTINSDAYAVWVNGVRAWWINRGNYGNAQAFRRNAFWPQLRSRLQYTL